MSHSIALTGATGFIGSALASQLQQSGYRVKALLRPRKGADTSYERGIEPIKGTLEDGEALARLVDGVDTVIHCAGAVRGASRDAFDSVNVSGVAALASIAATQKPRPRFLSLSSLAAREPSLSYYAASKREGERALARSAGDMKWMVLRPPAVYGKGDKELRPLFRWMRRGIAPILGPGDARLSLLHIDDLSSAVMTWLKSGCGESAIYEIHDGKPGGYSWGEVVKTAETLRRKRIVRIPVPEILLRVTAAANLLGARLLGYQPMLTPGKIRELWHPNWVCDNRALSNAIGWKPRVPLETGLLRTQDWGSN